MQAGTELNTLIAERVMGWDRDNEANNTDLNPWYFHRGIWWTGTTDDYDNVFPFSPSLNIDDAWRVVLRLRNIGKDCFAVEYVAGRGDWRASFGSNYSAENEWVADADSAPLAICRAALKAIS